MFIIPQYYYVIAAMYNDSLNLEYCSTSEKTTLIYIFSNLFLGPLFYHWVFLCFRIKKKCRCFNPSVTVFVFEAKI